MSSTLLLPPRAQFCIRYCSNKQQQPTREQLYNQSVVFSEQLYNPSVFCKRAQRGRPSSIDPLSLPPAGCAEYAVVGGERSRAQTDLNDSARDGGDEGAGSATMATPWLTGAGAVGHMRIRWTVEAHVADQEREIAIVFVKE
jgi:hypothetical protein